MSDDYNSVSWRDIVYYDETSPTYLKWKNKFCKKVVANTVAGGFNADKSRTILRYNTKLYLISRIVWVLHNGSIEESLQVDHIDGNSLNNSIGNLRLVTNAENGRNQKRRSNNSTGFTGVYFVEGKNAYIASYRDLNGENHTKFFSFSKYGDSYFSEACRWRLEMISLLNKKGAGYTDRHVFGITGTCELNNFIPTDLSSYVPKELQEKGLL